jgi:hypothetical protein
MKEDRKKKSTISLGDGRRNQTSAQSAVANMLRKIGKIETLANVLHVILNQV